MLVTLNEIKTYLGITDTTYDDFLTQQGTLISNVIESYCRRIFSQASYVQTFYRDENPLSSVIKVFHWPLISVTSIVEDGETLDSDYYRLNKPTGAIIRKSENGPFFRAEETVVSYTAGFATIPNPVKHVVFSLVQERYNKKISGVDLNFGSDVQRLSIPGAISIDFDYTLSNNNKNNPFGIMLGSQANVLGYYKSERAILGNDKLVYVDDGVTPPQVFGSYDAPLTITASGGIESSQDQRQAIFVQSAGGAVTITANPQIAAGSRVGQEIVLEGTSDTNYIILNNGNGLALAGSVSMIDRQILNLFWDGFVWTEVSRN